MLHIDHTAIALALTLVKRHTEILQEPQHRILVGGQAMQEIASGTLLRPTSCGRVCHGGRLQGIGLPAFLRERLILRLLVSHCVCG